MGKIEVKIETEDRMKAITNLSIAIMETAKALNRPPEVTIRDNTFTGGDPAILVDTVKDVRETTVVECEGMD